MSIITLSTRPERTVLVIEEDVEAPTRYLRCHSDGKKVTLQKSFILRIDDDSGECEF